MNLKTAAIILLFPAISQAYSYIDNRGLLPIGEVEALMANTGVALSGSTGAVYYNPAGLASLEHTHLSISANSYFKTSSELDPIQILDGTPENFHAQGLQTIPTSFVSTGRVGDFRYAFSILIPHQLKIEDSTAYSSPHYPSIEYSRTNSFQLLMIGPSIAARFNEADLGVGCFFTMYSTTQSSMLTAGTNGSTNALVLNDYFDASVNGVSCNLGAQKQVTPTLRAGLVLRSPFSAVSRSGTSTQFVQRPTDGLSVTTGPSSVEAQYAMPFDASIGFEYRVMEDLSAYLDVGWQAAASLTSGDIGAGTDQNHAQARGSLGLRYVLNSVVNLFAGAQFNPSSVETSENAYSEDFIEATIGSRWSYSNTNLSLGLMYASSTGSKPAPIFDYQINQIGETTASVHTSAVGVLLSSGYLF